MGSHQLSRGCTGRAPPALGRGPVSVLRNAAAAATAASSVPWGSPYVRELHRRVTQKSLPTTSDCHSHFSFPPACFPLDGREPTTEPSATEKRANNPALGSTTSDFDVTDEPVNGTALQSSRTAPEWAEVPPRGEESWVQVLEAEPRFVWRGTAFSCQSCLWVGEWVLLSSHRHCPGSYFLSPSAFHLRVVAGAPLWESRCDISNMVESEVVERERVRLVVPFTRLHADNTLFATRFLHRTPVVAEFLTLLCCCASVWLSHPPRLPRHVFPFALLCWHTDPDFSQSSVLDCSRGLWDFGSRSTIEVEDL